MRSLPGSFLAGLGADVSTNPVHAEANRVATQLATTLHDQNNVRLKYNLAAPSLYSSSSTVVEPVTSLPMAPSSHDPPVAASPESSANVVFVAQPLPPTLTSLRELATQILRDRLACQEGEFSRSDISSIECEAQLQSLQEQVVALLSSQSLLRSDTDAARLERVVQDKEIFSLLQTIKAFHTSDVKLTSTCSTLRSRATVHALAIAALRAGTHVIASGTSQSDKKVVAHKCGHFASIFRLLAYHIVVL